MGGPGGSSSGGVITDASVHRPDASAGGGGTGGSGGATGGGTANTTGGRTGASGSGGSSGATGGASASTGGADASTGGRDASSAAGGSTSTGGTLSTGGAGGVTCGSADAGDAGLPKPECNVNGECPTGKACTGQRPSKICVPEADYCDDSMGCVQHNTGCVNHRCLPPLPLGAACRSSQECAQSQYCEPAADGGSGVCVPQLGAFSDCSDSTRCDQTGPAPSLCWYSGDFMTGSYVCRPPFGEAARCDFAIPACLNTLPRCSECDVGLTCMPDPHNVDPNAGDPNFGYPYSWVSRCTSHLPGTLDAYCGWHPALTPFGLYEPCQAGLYCKETHFSAFPGDSEIYQCAPAAKLGEACPPYQAQYFDRDCDRGLICDYANTDGGSNKFACRKIRAGDTCNGLLGPTGFAVWNNDCGPGFACICDSSNGLCVSQTCQPAVGRCEPCGDATHTLPCESNSYCGPDHRCHASPPDAVAAIGCSITNNIDCPDKEHYCGGDSLCHQRVGIGEPCVAGDPFASDGIPLQSATGAMCAQGLRCVDGFLDGSCH